MKNKFILTFFLLLSVIVFINGCGDDDKDDNTPVNIFIGEYDRAIASNMKVYVNTSVFGGYYDDEFKEWTPKFFEEVENGTHQIVISALHWLNRN